MKIALFLNDVRLKALHVNALSVKIISISNNEIEGVEDHSLYSKDLNYISLWLIRREVNVIYLHNADDDIRAFFNRIGVEVKIFEDLAEDPILRFFLL